MGFFRQPKKPFAAIFEKLEDEGFLTRTYGGAVLNTAMLTENIHFYKRASSFYEEKQLIARKALPFTNNKPPWQP
ncbi:hypothetical protein MJ581_10225 [Escherichia coli]|nr:hypothetical protein MJ581_10225 [Escherichia coli]